MGFGSANSEYWLGNQLIHILTNQAWYELRIDMTDTDGVSKFVKYNVFSVDDSKTGYRLYLDGFNTESDIEDTFSYHSGQKFPPRIGTTTTAALAVLRSTEGAGGIPAVTMST